MAKEVPNEYFWINKYFPPSNISGIDSSYYNIQVFTIRHNFIKPFEKGAWGIGSSY